MHSEALLEKYLPWCYSQKVLPEPLKSVYSTVTYTKKEVSIYKEQPSFKDVIFNSIQTFKEDDPHHYILLFQK